MVNDDQQKQFEINRKQVGNLFKTNAFKIPDFQRDYDWDTENTTFLSDIKEALDVGGLREEYYVGTVISHKDDRGFHQVIDGQQRITSLFILIAAYWIHLGKIASTRGKQGGVEVLLVKKDMDDFKLSAEEMDDDVYVLSTTDPNGEIWIKELMKTAAIPSGSLNESNTRHQNALKRAIKFYKDSDDPDKLYKFIKNNIIITHVEALDFRQSYIVFERMNDRGKELTIPDKIKYILMGKHTSDLVTFRQYSKAINEKWRLVSDQFRDDNEFTTYLIHYFVAFLIEDNKWVDQNEAVNWFKIYWRKQSTPSADLLDDMLEKAKLYNGFKEAMDNSSPPQKNQSLAYKRTYYSSSITQHLPMLLAASKLKTEQFNIVAEYVLKLCFVMQVTKTNWQSIRASKNNSITSFVQDIRKEDMDGLEENVRGLFRQICFDSNFSSTICAQGFFEDGKRNDLRKFTILKVEELVMNEAGGTFVFQDIDSNEPEEKQKNAKNPPKPKKTGERITLEHVIAKNTEAKALIASTPSGMHPEDIKQLIGRFGNYVALGEVLNKTLQDKPTREKIKEYKEQNRTDTAKLIFSDILSAKPKNENAETRTIKNYHYEPITLSYLVKLDKDDIPEFSENWDEIYNEEKKDYYINDELALGYFMEKQIAKREHIMLLVIQKWLGLTGKGKIKQTVGEKQTTKTISEDTLFKHPQEGTFSCSYCGK